MAVATSPTLEVPVKQLDWHQFPANQKEHIWRSMSIGMSMGADIAVNYPMWIAAKRLGAGLRAFPPTLRQVYKGGGSLWLSLGPTVMVEDASTTAIRKILPETAPFHGLLSAACSGAVAALLVASQTENIIAVSHARSLTIQETITSIVKERSISGLLLPQGMSMMAAREVPFAAALFYVQPWLSHAARLDEDSIVGPERAARQLACGVGSSLLATPPSQVPAVIAAYQQGHGVSIREAVEAILAKSGPRGLWAGLWARTLSLTGTFTVVPVVLRALGAEH
eukprot:TRINITY_DN63547_c0_g1_i1.p1 TRINITY_DN63547_c0_g1~~TRINITY_DN63547_c0_g1_i1.p1  ORF type:complete len:301 (+),score=48.18 TRINITY_DN63547_c0_g1_i1:62-904(+)